MGVFVVGNWTGGGGCAEVRNVLHHGGSGGDILQVVVVSHVPTYWEYAGRFSPSGVTAADGANAIAEQGWDLVIPSLGGGNGRGEQAGGRYLCHPTSQHFHAIYHNKANYVPVYGDGTASRGVDFEWRR